MTLEKAIVIQTINNEQNPNYTDAEREQAHQLGIEALKRVKKEREIQGGLYNFDLPSETRE